MNYHTALDVSLRSVSICIVDDAGTIQCLVIRGVTIMTM